jgi:hypothetical protein
MFPRLPPGAPPGGVKEWRVNRGKWGESMPSRYIKKILNAQIYDLVKETPVHGMHFLSKSLQNRVLVKREDLQPVFSFKIRGAYSKLLQLTPAERKRGVIAASAGNHAQGVAMAASHLGIRATIVMPVTTPEIKVQSVRERGGEAVLYGDAFDEACAHAYELAEKNGYVFVHPYDGVGACFVERIPVKDGLAAALADGLHLDFGRRHRHHDRRADAEVRGRHRHTLRVVAGRGGDDPALPLRRRQLQQFAVGAADLEGKDGLEILALDQHPVLERLAEEVHAVYRRFLHQVIDLRVQDFLDVA